MLRSMLGYGQWENGSVTRRRMIWLAPPALGALGIVWWRTGQRRGPLPAIAIKSRDVSIVEYSANGVLAGTTSIPKVVRSESEWSVRLTPQQFYVTRTGHTDEPFTGTFHRMHTPGLFRCICCDAALFSSQSKYDSGTGWPAFREPIALGNVRMKEIPGLPQDAALRSGIEVLCALCDAHLGHIFSDGPAPGGLRYCINESALRFVPLPSA